MFSPVKVLPGQPLARGCFLPAGNLFLLTGSIGLSCSPVAPQPSSQPQSAGKCFLNFYFRTSEVPSATQGKWDECPTPLPSVAGAHSTEASFQKPANHPV